MVADSIHSKINVSGGISGSSDYDSEASITLGILNITHGHTYKHLNFSYGLMGYYGQSSNNHIDRTITNNKQNYLAKFSKNVGGIGLQTSIGYHFTSDRGNTDYRLINFENSLTREFGQYASFRSNLYGDQTYQNLLVSKLQTVWTTGLSSEIIFHHRRNVNIRHGFKLFMGFSPMLSESFDHQVKGDHYRVNRSNFQLTYFLKYQKFNLIYQGDMAMLSSSLSLGYTF
jgi:hypothetical protein